MSELPSDPFTPLSPDELNDLRLRIVRGEQPTPEEMKAVVQTMQMARSTVASAAEKKTKPRKKASAGPPVDLSNFLTKPL